MRWQASNGNSSFHGLALSAQKRLSNGFQFQTTFNFSKTLDMSSDVTSGEVAVGQRTLYFWDPDLLWARSVQDVTKTFVTNFVYDVPFGNNLTGVGGALAKGWQITGILTLTDGYPVTITDGSNAQRDRLREVGGLRANLVSGGDTNPVSGTSAGCTIGTGSRARTIPAGAELGGPDLYYDPCQFEPSTLGFFGNLGRSTLVTPGLASLDFSLLKNFTVSEENRLQFRAELFNSTNRVNLRTPDTSPFDSSGRPDPNAGRITATRGSPRQIQFGLKYTF
jgi:hypothetical protein